MTDLSQWSINNLTLRLSLVLCFVSPCILVGACRTRERQLDCKNICLHGLSRIITHTVYCKHLGTIRVHFTKLKQLQLNKLIYDIIE